MKIFKAIFKTLTDICIFCLFLILIAFLYSKYISKDKMPNVLGYSVLKIVSGSMENNYSIGDYIVIKSQKQYKINDVVTYVDSYDNFVTHRIVKIEGRNITTKGDANNIEDEAFDVAKIQGKVVYKLPRIFSKINTITVLITIVTLFIMRLIVEKFIISQ